MMKKKRRGIWAADTWWGRAVNFLALPVHELIMLSRWPWRAKGAALDLTGYTLAFEDTFEGGLDEAVWQPHGEGQRKGGYWDKGQARAEGGNLVIRTQYKEDGPHVA